MTPERINIAIAEFRGWKWYRRPASGPWAKKPFRALYHPDMVPEYVATLQLADMTERECNYVFIMREGLIPDHYRDLNAMHGAEQHLGDDPADGKRSQWSMFKANLKTVCLRDEIDPIHAAAPQRSEALLRTIGEWKDSR